MGDRWTGIVCIVCIVLRMVKEIGKSWQNKKSNITWVCPVCLLRVRGHAPGFTRLGHLTIDHDVQEDLLLDYLEQGKILAKRK